VRVLDSTTAPYAGALEKGPRLFFVPPSPYGLEKDSSFGGCAAYPERCRLAYGRVQSPPLLKESRARPLLSTGDRALAQITPLPASPVLLALGRGPREGALTFHYSINGPRWKGHHEGPRSPHSPLALVGRMWCMQLDQYTNSCGSGNSLFTGRSV
jgi:hypothetical protein